MKSPEAEAQLLEAMQRLETAANRVMKTDGYKDDAKKIRLLIELIKEQVRNENLVSSASPVR